MRNIAPTGALVRRIAIAALGLLGLAMISFGVLNGLTKEREAMRPTTTSAALEAALPAIDRAAPAQFETATFALG